MSMKMFATARAMSQAIIAAASHPTSGATAAAGRQHVQKLFIANVPWTVGNRELKLYFSKYGHVATATIVYDKQCGMSRGFGFVLYSNKSGYNAAVQQTHALEGRALIVQPASSSAKVM